MSTEIYIGKGLYSPWDASKLTGVPTQSISNWLFGYKYKNQGSKITSNPVWKPEIPFETFNEKALSFLDLIEIRFIHAFRQEGLSLQLIRKAAARAQELYQEDHPFARRHFHTDGKTVFQEVIKESGEIEFLEIFKSQYAFEKVLRPFMRGSIEFDDIDGKASRWYPNGKKDKSIVIDPKLSFGKPILDNYGIPTYTLYKAYSVEGTYRAVSDIFDVPEKLVKKAVIYEESLT